MARKPMEPKFEPKKMERMESPKLKAKEAKMGYDKPAPKMAPPFKGKK